MSTTGNLVNFYVIWIQRKKINKIELSHTSQVENPDHVTHFLHCNKGNKMRPYGGQNGDVWLSFSLHPTDMKSTCQLLSKTPLSFGFWCLFSCFLCISSQFLWSFAKCFVIWLPPKGSKDWIFMSSTQISSESPISQTKLSAWLHSKIANSLAINW